MNIMDVKEFVKNYQEAFGNVAPLPFAFWYSDAAAAQTKKIGGCFFKGFQSLNDETEQALSLCLENIGCGGGKFYTGFTDMPEQVPEFVSLKEKYVKTPEMFREYKEKLVVPRAEKKYLNFKRIDKLENFSEIEGLLFFASPDILSGLTCWAFFDNSSDGAVSTPFGSGCSTVVTQTINENRRGGRRTFIGFFDPSVRPHFDANILSFTIPMSRFKEMYQTIKDTCLFGTHAWAAMQKRINGDKN